MEEEKDFEEEGIANEIDMEKGNFSAL